MSEAAASTDEDVAAAFRATFKKLIEKGYKLEQVFNMDETALLEDAQKFVTKKEAAPIHRASKERVTMLFGANAAVHTIKQTVFTSLSTLKGKKKNLLPVYWISNSMTSTTKPLFLDWFHKCFVPETTH